MKSPFASFKPAAGWESAPWPSISEADSRALHVQKADEALPLSGVQAQESYLNGEKIISAALSTGCQAIHPGYGFLSENPQFARVVMDAGLTFIGPPEEAIALMGDKIASKELAIKAGVPVIPGHVDALSDADEALARGGKHRVPGAAETRCRGWGQGHAHRTYP